MPSPATTDEFLDLVRRSGLIEAARLDEFIAHLDAAKPPASPRDLSQQLVQDGLLTNYQSVLLLKGRWDSFKVGPYRILDRLGFGAVSNVYLCEHRANHQRFAVKVLTAGKARDEVALKRFYREARAAASLDHPNLVRVRDIDWADDTQFMVMDFVDGSSIQDIVQRGGPMAVERAAHYIQQAAQGLQYAHEKGLVHRDIKPANLLIDRTGRVKILDMGLARFAEEEGSDLTQGEMLGTPEYLAPEQAVDSHNVDIRADIYSLGATLYFMLAGEPPYNEEKSKAGKLLSKEKRPPKPIRDKRPAVPEELVAVVDRMMSREAKQRHQTPQEVVDALAPWTVTPIGPPPAKEMPQVAATGRAPANSDRPTRKSEVAAVKPAPPPSEPSTADAWTLAATVQVVVIFLLGIAAFVGAWFYLGGRR